ncbi:hypothetical protein C0J52_22924 [Blattella germanica]|nr:hypothetical protein C0J52_22924 [Blattella germanica]
MSTSSYRKLCRVRWSSLFVVCLCEMFLYIAISLLIIYCVDCQDDSVNEARLLKLIQQDESAHVIWNFTNKYRILHISNIDAKCLDEIESNEKILYPYYFNITGIQTFDFFHSFKYKNPKSFQQVQEMQQQSSELIEDVKLFYQSTEKMLKEMGVNGTENNFCLLKSNSYRCDCFDPRNFIQENNFNEKAKLEFNSLRFFVTFGWFISDPILYNLIMLIGGFVNVILLIKSIKESSIRNEYHFIIFNIAINNLITLLVFLPLPFFASNQNERVQYVRNVIDILVISVSTLSVLLLLIQRCCFLRSLKQQVHGCRLNSKGKCISYTSCIWICRVGIACIASVTIENYSDLFLQLFIYLLVYILILFLVISIFSCLASKVFQNTAKQEKTLLEVENTLVSKGNFTLVLTYYLAHILLLSLVYFQLTPLYYVPDLCSHILYTVINTFVALYPSWIWLILYKCNNIYRKHFRKIPFQLLV